MANPVLDKEQMEKQRAMAELGKMESRAAVIWKRYKKNKMAVIGLFMFLFMIFISVFAPLLTPYDPEVYDINDSYLEPSLEPFHPFGTDGLGGDVYTRALFGGRVSLSVALMAMVCTVMIGVVYGAISGYFGGWVDNVMMRIVDALQSIPSFFLLLIIASMMVPTIWTTVFALSIVGWTGMSRLVRSEILSIKRRDFVEAARATGEKRPSIIFYHILPNTIAPITVLATLDIAANIIAESVLSYLGLGIQPPVPSWGNMLSQAQDVTTITDYAWVAIWPGLFIIFSVLAVNFIGDGLRDALDPRMKQ